MAYYSEGEFWLPSRVDYERISNGKTITTDVSGLSNVVLRRESSNEEFGLAALDAPPETPIMELPRNPGVTNVRAAEKAVPIGVTPLVPPPPAGQKSFVATIFEINILLIGLAILFMVIRQMAWKGNRTAGMSPLQDVLKVDSEHQNTAARSLILAAFNIASASRSFRTICSGACRRRVAGRGPVDSRSG